MQVTISGCSLVNRPLLLKWPLLTPKGDLKAAHKGTESAPPKRRLVQLCFGPPFGSTQTTFNFTVRINDFISRAQGWKESSVRKIRLQVWKDSKKKKKKKRFNTVTEHSLSLEFTRFFMYLRMNICFQVKQKAQSKSWGKRTSMRLRRQEKQNCHSICPSDHILLVLQRQLILQIFKK